MNFNFNDSSKYVFVGIDLHKEEHTAVIADYTSKKAEVIKFERKPSAYPEFIEKVNKFVSKGKSPIFGLEDTKGYGRSLAVFLVENNFIVKEVNASLSKAERKSNPTVKKNDAWDAECITRILYRDYDRLPNANPIDIYWTFRQLTNRRDTLVESQMSLKNQLHDSLSHHFPSYKKFFSEVDGKTALEFWIKYPSPSIIKGVSVEDLTDFSRENSNNACSTRKAKEILELVASDGDTTREYQSERDFAIQSIVRQIKFLKEEIEKINRELKKLLKKTGLKLETMPGISTVMASNLVAHIGDVNRFKNPYKLASYAGIAPVKFSSAGKGKEYKNKQGKRHLNGIFYMLTLQQIQVSRKTKSPRNPVIYEYYNKKISEGKSPTQALVWVQRRLVDIIYKMMKYKIEYELPDIPKTLVSWYNGDSKWLSP